MNTRLEKLLMLILLYVAGVLSGVTFMLQLQ